MEKLGPKRERDKPRAGSVASKLKLHGNGAAGFIDWLGGPILHVIL
jgi:hypothetical protein